LMDQMLAYGNLRKTAKKKESYSLDYTLRSELKESKLEYEGSIRDFAYRNYFDFLLYGALDVTPMLTLEQQLGDIALMYTLSMLTRTRYHYVLKKTICLRNFAAKFYEDRGFVLSNNRNKNIEHEKTSFKGAFVCDPLLQESTGTAIGGIKSNRIFDWVTDYDLKSLYPSIIMAFNIDPTGQRAILSLPNGDGTEADGSELISSMVSGEITDAYKEVFNLPSLEKLIGVCNA